MRKNDMFFHSMIIKKLLIISILVVEIKSYVITNPKDGQNNQINNNNNNRISSPSSQTKLTRDTSNVKISDNQSSNATSIDNNIIEDSSPAQEELEQFWLNERLAFFNQTTFYLTKVKKFIQTR